MSRSGSTYRRDIDGLRAIAVVLVVVFHAFPKACPGGFCGVDVFFVISGFLITGILLDSLERGTFSVLEFYSRRARRIFPALIVVLACVVIGGWFALLPDEFEQLGKQIFSGAAFIGNLMQESGYFNTAAENKPLLHLWSLGIEEQFYLVWPWLLFLCAPRGRRFVLRMSVGLVLVSFLCNLVLIRNHPTLTFYAPFTRFWELAIGSVLACRRGAEPMPDTAGSRRVKELLSFGGLGMIAAAAALLANDRPYPGAWALLPTLGSAIIIASGPSTWLATRLLARPALVLVGLWSYPIYLWHWPLLSLTNIVTLGEGGSTTRGAVVLMAMILAAGTYYLVEKPIRSSVPSRRLLVALSGAMALVGAAGLTVFARAGFPERPGVFGASAAFDHWSAYRRRTCFLEPSQGPEAFSSECVDAGDATSELIMVWGDSHAASIFPGFRALQTRKRKYRLAQFTTAACPPVEGIGDEGSNCAAINARVLESIAKLRPHIVVLGGYWLRYQREWDAHDPSLERLARTIEKIQGLGVERVVVFGPLPTYDVDQPRIALACLREGAHGEVRTYRLFKPEARIFEPLVEHAVAKASAVFVSPLAELCNADGCLVSTSDSLLSPLAWDNSHLTTAGATLLVERSDRLIWGN